MYVVSFSALGVFCRRMRPYKYVRTREYGAKILFLIEKSLSKSYFYIKRCPELIIFPILTSKMTNSTLHFAQCYTV